MDCPICGGRMERKKAEYCFQGTPLGSYDADVCAKCGEEVNVRAVIIENLKRARALRTGVQFQP